MAEAKGPALKDTAKEFTLNDHNGQVFRLSDHAGKKVLLSFHPLAWTPICAMQMQDLEEKADRFDALNTVAVGVSIDSVPCKKAWAESLGLRRTRLLSDFWPHGAVARSFNVFRDENGFSERCNIIVGEKGGILFVKIYPIRQVPDLKEILAVLK